MSVGSTIYMDDGKLQTEVTEIGESWVKVLCKNAHRMGERKKINLPGAIIDLPTLTQQDEIDITDFGLKPENDIDFISATFVRKASDVENIRDILSQKRADHIKIISKIENEEGLRNFEDILAVSDGVMVLRGDLEMEIPAEKVFIAQKWMIEKANLAAKPIILSTQICESMEHPKATKPTRIEAADIATAVLDGADAIQLDKITSLSKKAVENVEAIAAIMCEAESTLNYKQAYQSIAKFTPFPVSPSESLASTVCAAVLDQKDIQLIFVTTENGKIARLVSKYRPEVKILAATTNPKVVEQINLCRGVTTVLGNYQDDVKAGIEYACTQKMVSSGAKVAVIQSSKEGTAEESSFMNIVTA